MGYFFKSELFILGKIINILPVKEDLFKTFENEMIEDYFNNNNNKLLSQMEILSSLVKFILDYFKNIVQNFYNNKMEDELELFARNMKTIHKKFQNKNKNSMIMISSKTVKKYKNKLEYCCYCVDFYIFYIKSNKTNFLKLTIT